MENFNKHSIMKSSKHSTYTDAELVTLLNKGDDAAFVEIFDRHYTLVLLFCRKKLGDYELAKDFVQELFTDIWAKHSLVFTDNLPGYLIKSAKNRIYDYYEHQGVQLKYFWHFSASQQSINNTDHLARESQLNRLIETEIDQLPPKMKQIFELNWVFQ